MNFCIRTFRQVALALLARLLCTACHFQPDLPANLPPLTPIASTSASSTATTTAAPAAQAPIDTSKLTISAPDSGVIHVSGAPGCVTDPGIKAIWVAAIHDLLKTYRTLHVGSTYLVAITPEAVPVASDGSFADVSIGDPGQPIQPQDKLYIYPKISDSQPFGTPVVTTIP